MPSSTRDPHGAVEDVLELQPARASLLGEREAIGEVVAIPGARQEIAGHDFRVARARPAQEIVGPFGEGGHSFRGHVEPPEIGAAPIGQSLAGPCGLDEDDAAAEGQGGAAPAGSRQ